MPPRAPRILVVENEPDVRELVTDSLQSAGYSCSSASTIEETLVIAGRYSPSIALLDVGLQRGENGLDLARRLREAHKDLAVILMTGLKRSVVTAEAVGSGVLDCLFKPFTRDDLLWTVKHGLKW